MDAAITEQPQGLMHTEAIAIPSCHCLQEDALCLNSGAVPMEPLLQMRTKAIASPNAVISADVSELNMAAAMTEQPQDLMHTEAIAIPSCHCLQVDAPPLYTVAVPMERLLQMRIKAIASPNAVISADVSELNMAAAMTEQPQDLMHTEAIAIPSCHCLQVDAPPLYTVAVPMERLLQMRIKAIASPNAVISADVSELNMAAVPMERLLQIKTAAIVIP
jgi:hypothetical protein